MDRVRTFRLLVGVSLSVLMAAGLAACGEPDAEADARASCIAVCERVLEECSGSGSCEDECDGLVAKLTTECHVRVDALQTCLLTNDVPLCTTGDAPDTCAAEQAAFDAECRALVD